jgi:hypothetical protein
MEEMQSANRKRFKDYLLEGGLIVLMLKNERV